MKERLQIKIRFNTNYREEDTQTKEWRVIVNGVENFCNHVSVNCPSKTSKDFIEGVGNKWHISCEAERIEYVQDEAMKGKTPNSFKEIILY
ncbi:MAG TPA: hypothetical protein VN698_12800 [Bacteroidia bacterium]|nr:hypothetical protein [Bacteroidia bacterium]